MNNGQTDESRIKELLKEIREQEAPVWIKRKIMQRVYNSEPRMWHRLTKRLSQLPRLRFSPAGLVFVTMLVCAAFLSGMLVEHHSAGMESEQTINLPALADNARASYLIGRGLLAGNQRETALGFFRRAVELDPNSAEYIYWQGVAYWATGQEELEKQSYFQTMKDHPEYLPALLNLGHNYLESGDYSTALHYYQQVLQRDPHIPAALYNSGLAYQKLDNEAQEKAAFRHYLGENRAGKWSCRAVDHLNQLGDFTFRSYRVGTQRVVLNVADLLQPDSAAQQKELQLLARAVNRAAGQELQIIVYNRDEQGAAKATAINLRDRLQRLLGAEHVFPVRASWFNAAETITSGNGPGRQLSPSVLIFSTPVNEENRRKSI
jgi:tetratricopeptide (TPR) repeat protein